MPTHLVHPHAGRRLAALERRLGVRFANKDLLREALTVTSHQRPSNYRAEWLGDKVLAAVAALYVYGQDGLADRQSMNRAVNQLITNALLKVAAETYQIEKCLLFEAAWTTTSPKYLADAVEAILAAITLDQGFDAAYDFLVDKVFPLITLVEPSGPTPTATKPPKQNPPMRTACRELLELLRPFGWDHVPFAQVKWLQTPAGPVYTYAVIIGQTTLGVGTGPTTTAARFQAALAAICTIHEQVIAVPSA